MKKIKLFMLLISTIFMTGCINYTELNDIGIITSIAIDKIDKNYSIDINMIIPTTDNKNNSKNINIITKNLSTLINDIYIQSSRRIDLSHLELLILRDGIKKEEINTIFTYFNSIIEIRGSFNVIYSNDTIKSSKEAMELIKINSENNSIISVVTYDDILSDILEYQISYIPIIDDMKITGYRSIYEENKNLTIEESVALNFIQNKINTLHMSTTIDYIINSSNTWIDVNNNIITFNISTTVTNLTNTKNIENIVSKDIYELISKFLNNNNQNYFYNLIKKYEYNYYINNPNISPSFIFNIKILENTMKGENNG